MNKNFLSLLLLTSITACTFIERQAVIPSETFSLPTSTQFVYLTPFPTHTTTPTISLDPSDRTCSSNEFKTPNAIPNFNNLESLIGFQTSKGWLPDENWEGVSSVYDPDFDYSIRAYKNTNQYLFVLKKLICRYEENRNSLSEIRDYIFIPQLETNEIILFDLPYFLSSSKLNEIIVPRLDFKLEMRSMAECIDVTPPHTLMLAKINTNEIPEKIEPGTQLSIQAFQGWSIDTNTYTFSELLEIEISCVITFHGY